MKSKLLYAALFATLSISVAAIAAEDMGKNMVMPADKMERAEQPIKKAVEPHNYNEFNTQGAPAPEKSADAAEAM